MRILILLATAGLVVMPRARADAQSSAGVAFLERERVEAAFAQGRPLLEVADYKIHASRREGPGMAEIHTRDTDIVYVLQGSATLVTGGTAVAVKEIAPEELRGTAIQGGETRPLSVGDLVVIPTGVPHWFKEVQAPFLYYVVKVRQADQQKHAGAM